MALDMVLNELSLQTPASDTFVAKEWMSGLIKTVKTIKTQVGGQPALRTQYNFYTILLAPNYPLSHWLNDHEVDREKRRFIRNLVTKAPFSEKIFTGANFCLP